MLILCRVNGSYLFISIKKSLHISNHCKLMHTLFLDFEPEATTVTKSLILLAFYSVVKQCYMFLPMVKFNLFLTFSPSALYFKHCFSYTVKGGAAGFCTPHFSYAALHHLYLQNQKQLLRNIFTHFQIKHKGCGIFSMQPFIKQTTNLFHNCIIYDFCSLRTCYN